jgi:hypothetical protein
MSRVGNFFICGNHAQPISLPVTERPAHPLMDLLEQLPTPLALPISEYLGEEGPFIALHRLTDAAELITRFFAIVAVGILSFLLFYFSYYRPHRAAWKTYQAIRQELFNTAQQLSEVVIQKARCMLNAINIRKLDRFSFFLKQRAETLHLYEYTLKKARQDETDKLSSETPFSPTESLFTKRPIKEETIAEEMKQKYQMFQLKGDEYRWQYISQFVEPLFLRACLKNRDKVTT